MRLIDADELRTKMIPLSFSVQKWANETDVVNCRTVEVEPVRHGHWEFCAESVEAMWNCKCSVCGSIEQPLQRHRYCPNCGAKMDEEERKEVEE